MIERTCGLQDDRDVQGDEDRDRDDETAGRIADNEERNQR
jgi:hypothetical protein